MPLTRSRLRPVKSRRRFASLMTRSRAPTRCGHCLKPSDSRCACTLPARKFLTDERGRLAGCLIIDQHMPGISGLDVVDSLRKQGARIPTILISGRLVGSVRRRAARLGVRELLEKPVAAGRLVELIRTTLADVA
jgi:FixJ family two-component response regulator